LVPEGKAELPIEPPKTLGSCRFSVIGLLRSFELLELSLRDIPELIAACFSVIEETTSGIFVCTALLYLIEEIKFLALVAVSRTEPFVRMEIESYRPTLP
jgi:hypothetical protein